MKPLTFDDEKSATKPSDIYIYIYIYREREREEIVWKGWLKQI
jgi:hypothetical protein